MTASKDSVVVPREAVQRLILAADCYGVQHLDSDDMDETAEELQAATEDMKDALSAAPQPADLRERVADAVRVSMVMTENGCCVDIDTLTGALSALLQPSPVDPRLVEWGYSSTEEAIEHLGKLLDDQAAFDGLASPVEQKDV